MIVLYSSIQTQKVCSPIKSIKQRSIAFVVLLTLFTASLVAIRLNEGSRNLYNKQREKANCQWEQINKNILNNDDIIGGCKMKIQIFIDNNKTDDQLRETQMNKANDEREQINNPVWNSSDAMKDADIRLQNLQKDNKQKANSCFSRFKSMIVNVDPSVKTFITNSVSSVISNVYAAIIFVELLVLIWSLGLISPQTILRNVSSWTTIIVELVRVTICVYACSICTVMIYAATMYNEDEQQNDQQGDQKSDQQNDNTNKSRYQGANMIIRQVALITFAIVMSIVVNLILTFMTEAVTLSLQIIFSILFVLLMAFVGFFCYDIYTTDNKQLATIKFWVSAAHNAFKKVINLIWAVINMVITTFTGVKEEEKKQKEE